MRIAFVTDLDQPRMSPDDALAARALERRGCAVHDVPWNDGVSDWRAFDAVVLRSCWDYWKAPGAFHAWLRDGAADGVPILNPPATVDWNLDKRYLRALAGAGVPTIPTAWIEPGSPDSLREILAGQGWSDAVFKPCVSASANNTRRVRLADVDAFEAEFQRLSRERPMMVQPFAGGIETEGEWSLMFFSGRYSHAVLKRPAAGDFRVQAQFGGSVSAATPPGAILQQAAAVLANAPGPVAYARVDGCVADGTFQLMELELIEPCLFFAHDPLAADRFADAVLRAIPRNGSRRRSGKHASHPQARRRRRRPRPIPPVDPRPAA